MHFIQFVHLLKGTAVHFTEVTHFYCQVEGGGGEWQDDGAAGRKAEIDSINID